MQLSFPIALTVAFAVLKLCHVITWSWVWVAAPIWIAGLAGLVVAFVFVAAGAIDLFFKSLTASKRAADQRERMLARARGRRFN